ncbi:hypothetical protein MRB53_004842 [Persea americana]|uniref:Uncharacterized protein n=1 Tax=Persea americana TaxID=3435 RepID=A0ACC2MCN1_PERAE|nr:hypothetical protein MRB53_004842 [Persea americana]
MWLDPKTKYPKTDVAGASLNRKRTKQMQPPTRFEKLSVSAAQNAQPQDLYPTRHIPSPFYRVAGGCKRSFYGKEIPINSQLRRTHMTNIR